MTKTLCKNCRHLKTAPYQAAHTGCWHPDLMQTTQKDAWLDQQQVPGNHHQINLNGDCAEFHTLAKKATFWQRFVAFGT
jgi:hypothetical protein